MKVLEIFTGSLQEKEALKDIKELRSQPKLNSRKKNRLTDAIKLRRHYYYRITILCLLPVILLVLAGASAYPDYRFNNRKKTVDESVQKVTANLPNLDLKAAESQMKKEPNALNHLILLKAFYGSVSWAEINVDGQIISMSSGNTKGAWIAFFQDEKMAKAQPYNLSISQENPNILQIKSTDFNPDWFGIFLLHEVSHLFDYAAGIEPANRNRVQYLNGEVIAYLNEKELLNNYTNGKFNQAIINFIKLHQLTNLDQAIAFWRKMRSNTSEYNAMIDFFSRALSMPQPQDQEEAGLCMALFQISVSFSLIDFTSPGSNNMNQYREFIEFLYSSQGLQN